MTRWDCVSEGNYVLYILFHYFNGVCVCVCVCVSVCFRDRLIDQLTREIQALKDELESFRLEVKVKKKSKHFFSQYLFWFH